MANCIQGICDVSWKKKQRHIIKVIWTSFCYLYRHYLVSVTYFVFKKSSTSPYNFCCIMMRAQFIKPCGCQSFACYLRYLSTLSTFYVKIITPVYKNKCPRDTDNIKKNGHKCDLIFCVITAKKSDLFFFLRYVNWVTQISPMKNFGDAIQGHPNCEDSDADIELNVGTYVAAVTKSEDKANAFPKSVVCKSSFRFVTE